MNLGIISSRVNSNRYSKSGVCDDYEYVSKCLDLVLGTAMPGFTPGDDVTLVSGGGRGPESLSKDYADRHDMQYTVIPPRRAALGAMAFSERNRSILSVVDALAVFWGGEDMYVTGVLSEAMFANKMVYLFPI